jgi:hypothetical protein
VVVVVVVVVVMILAAAAAAGGPEAGPEEDGNKGCGRRVLKAEKNQLRRSKKVHPKSCLLVKRL